MVKIEREIPIQIEPGENPFLKGIYARCDRDYRR